MYVQASSGKTQASTPGKLGTLSHIHCWQRKSWKAWSSFVWAATVGLGLQGLWTSQINSSPALIPTRPLDENRVCLEGQRFTNCELICICLVIKGDETDLPRAGQKERLRNTFMHWSWLSAALRSERFPSTVSSSNASMLLLLIFNTDRDCWRKKSRKRRQLWVKL